MCLEHFSHGSPHTARTAKNRDACHCNKRVRVVSSEQDVRRSPSRKMHTLSNLCPNPRIITTKRVYKGQFKRNK